MNEVPREYLEGIALFNQQKYFEAHEVWESVWMHSQGELRFFYQALIQAAAALLHLRNGNRIGTDNLLRLSQEKFSHVGSTMLGLNVQEFCGNIALFADGANSDFANAPKIQLSPDPE